MQPNNIPTLNEMRDFVLGGSFLRLSFENKSEAYVWLQKLLKSLGYGHFANMYVRLSVKKGDTVVIDLRACLMSLINDP